MRGAAPADRAAFACDAKPDFFHVLPHMAQRL